MLTVIDLGIIGQCCAAARLKHRVAQINIAVKTGYSPKTVSGFECGLNNNLTLFMYYFLEIMDAEDRANLLQRLGEV